MNIICSAEKGTLSHTDCLACALSEPPPCGYNYALLKAIYGRERPERAQEVHVTDITGCLAKSFYEKTDPAPELVADKLVRFLGVAVHESLESSDEHIDCEVPVRHMGIVGKSDIVYKNGLLLDLKTTRWMIPDRLPYGSHALQVNIYAYLLKQTGRNVERLMIQYVDMSGPTKCRKCNTAVHSVGGELVCPKCLAAPRGAHLGALLVEIPMSSDEEVKQIIQERTTALQQALDTGIAPAADPGFLCAYCANTLRCPAGMAYLSK